MYTDDDQTSDPAAISKERKALLERRGEIACGHCPYHRGENAKRQPKRKSWKRETTGKQWSR